MMQVMKIINNPKDGSLSYFIQNANQKWVSVSDFSELSRSSFRKLNIEDNSEILWKTIAKTYCGPNQYLRIILEGFDDIPQSLMESVKKFPAISIVSGQFSIAVVGKLKVGKSTLIEALGCRRIKSEKDYNMYSMKQSNWYEVKGIDLGRESYNETVNIISELQQFEQTSVFIYCLDSKAGKIENEEIELIDFLKNSYPNARVIVVITKSIDEDGARAFAERVKGMVKCSGVVPVLAKETETRAFICKAYGIDKLTELIYEGV